MKIFQKTTTDSFPAVISKQMNAMTLDKAMSQPNQISSLKKEMPRELNAILSSLVEDLAEAFNVKSNLTPKQIADTVTLIKSECWFMRPEEIMYAFRLAKTGRYGTSFNRMDTPTVMEFIWEYDKKDRNEWIEARDMANKTIDNEVAGPLVDIYLEEKKKIAETGKSSLQHESERKKAEEQKRLKQAEVTAAWMASDKTKKTLF